MPEAALWVGSYPVAANLRLLFGGCLLWMSSTDCQLLRCALNMHEHRLDAVFCAE